MAQSNFFPWIHRFDAPEVRAIVLMGSHARGDAGPFSDVDLVRLLAAGADGPDGDGSHLIDGQLVVVSDLDAATLERVFTAPELATVWIAGLRQGRPLVDRGGTFASVQARARSFVWDAAMQARANAWAAGQMVGWVEEVHKALEGLRLQDVGRLLNARFGLSWGMASVVKVQRGVLVTGDNHFFVELMAAVGPETLWSRLLPAAFGVADEAGQPLSLRRQVVAGLRLYLATVALLGPIWDDAQWPLIQHTVTLIQTTLEQDVNAL